MGGISEVPEEVKLGGEILAIFATKYNKLYFPIKDRTIQYILRSCTLF